MKMHWNKRTSWLWWEEPRILTDDSKCEPWRTEAEHATSRPRCLPTILNSIAKHSWTPYKQTNPKKHDTQIPVLVWCWDCVFDAGPTSNQHSVNMTCLLWNDKGFQREREWTRGRSTWTANSVMMVGKHSHCSPGPVFTRCLHCVWCSY